MTPATITYGSIVNEEVGVDDGDSFLPFMGVRKIAPNVLQLYGAKVSER